MRRPLAVAFDVMETLVSLAPVGAALDRAGAGPRALELWFARTLRDGFALAASGAFRPFGEVATGALAAVAPGVDAGAVLAALRDVPAYPDARPALERLRDADVPAVALTNGSPATTAHFLDTTGLAPLVDRVVSIEQVGAWKPSPAPYLAAAGAVGVPPDRLAMVAAHAWDVHGAHRAGLVTGWTSRLEGAFAAVFEPPDVAGDDLVEVVDGLLALPA